MNELHRLVCAGQLDLKTAQHDISSDWIAAYRKYLHSDLPLSAHQHRRGSRRREAGVQEPAGAPSGAAR